MGNTIGLPACPRGNSMNLKLKFTQFGGTQPLNLTGATIYFIANQHIDGKTAPPVFISQNQHLDPVNGLSEINISNGLTSTLLPGDYYFNINIQDAVGDVNTYAAGTWPITPVPGLVSGAA